MPWTDARRAMVLVWLIAAAPYLTACTTATTPNRPPSAVDQLEDDITTYLERHSLTDVRAVIVVADERTVVEEYYDSTAEEYLGVFSVTKSVVSTLVGIAVDEGLLDLEMTLAELLPAYAETMTIDVAGTTLEQLLTMTGGFPDTWFGPSVEEEATPPPDWVASDLQSAVRPPGQGFAYSDPGVDLVASILAEATGRSVLQYARDKLFTPLGVDTEPAAEPLAVPTDSNIDAYEAAGFAWPVDPQGIHIGSSLLKLRPRDMANFGSLHLHEGRWDGQQVVSRAWVHEATTDHVPARGAAPSYGYLWWTGAEADDTAAYLAWGHGGQLIEIVPERELVVVIASAVDLRDPDGATNPSLMTQLVDSVIAPTIGE